MFGNHIGGAPVWSKYMSAKCRACRQCVAGMSVACRGRVAVVCPRYRCVAACYKRLDFIGVGGVGAGGWVLFSLCFLRCEAANHFCGIALRPASPRTLGPTLEIPGRRNSPAFPPLFSATSCSRPVRSNNSRLLTVTVDSGQWLTTLLTKELSAAVSQWRRGRGKAAGIHGLLGARAGCTHA